ncbi:MAG: recombinase family protein [Dehalococcoidia bacterium]|nr:recombinase family protein [Dehalococcoidia bacterium]
MAGQLRAVVYSRVSTDAQERDGSSLDTQERASREYVDANRWALAESIRDTASGYSLDRPGIERLRLLLRQDSVDVVVAYAVDRLSRNQNHIGVLFDEVEQAGARLQFVTEKFEDTAIGRFILAARAFIGEVEREKIVERTMRGKAEKARSGRIPQGTGKGLYGYHYDRDTGKREIDPVQAGVVSGIFQGFLHGDSIVAMANRLNEARIPTMTGGMWYPATLHTMLRNETYTGRTIYRRTLVRRVRDPRTGKKRKKVEIRNPSEWIEIPGVTPSIIDESTYTAVQTLLDDPERRRLGRRIYDYALSGRVQCLVCGKAMVGQTLSKRYRYYKCRRAFAGPRHDRCDTSYVRADNLERAVQEEIVRVLANPEIIMAEHQRLRSSTNGESDKIELGRQLDALEGQRSRLIKLYQLGEVDDQYLESESRSLRTRITEIEIKMQHSSTVPALSLGQLHQACARVREWIETAQGDDYALLTDALQLRVLAQKDRGELTGIIPEYASDNGHADVCSMVINPRL